MKRSLYFTIVFLTMSLFSVQLRAEHYAGGSKEGIVTSTVYIQRLKEIKAMDHSQLTQFEKVKLRKEVLSIQDQLKTMDGGVYLSVGAIIIIILLLILIL